MKLNNLESPKNKPDFSREETLTELVKCYLKPLLNFLLIAI